MHILNNIKFYTFLLLYIFSHFWIPSLLSKNLRRKWIKNCNLLRNQDDGNLMNLKVKQNWGKRSWISYIWQEVELGFFYSEHEFLVVVFS
jgi:hypothetical protein